MTASGSWIYAFGVAALLVHEVDAVRCREWRLLYVFRDMPEDRARIAFVWLHWPLTLLLLAPFMLQAPVADWIAVAVGIFAVVHLALHLRLRSSPKSEFAGLTSFVPIWAAAVFGALYCVTVLSQ